MVEYSGNSTNKSMRKEFCILDLISPLLKLEEIKVKFDPFTIENLQLLHHKLHDLPSISSITTEHEQ